MLRSQHTYSNNPLTLPVFSFLNEKSQSNEYEIIRFLEGISADIWFLPLSEDYELRIFQKHFLVRNALYRLQRQLEDEPSDQILRIDVLGAYLEERSNNRSEGQAVALNSSGQALADFYLDWNNYRGATTEFVKSLLTEFWDKYISEEAGIKEYLSILGLEEAVSRAELRKRYKLLLQRNHPDKGGSPDKFHEIRDAYQHLLPICK